MISMRKRAVGTQCDRERENPIIIRIVRKMSECRRGGCVCVCVTYTVVSEAAERFTCGNKISPDLSSSRTHSNCPESLFVLELSAVPFKCCCCCPSVFSNCCDPFCCWLSAIPILRYVDSSRILYTQTPE